MELAIGENSSEKCWEIGRTTYGGISGGGNNKSKKQLGYWKSIGKEKKREEERGKEEDRQKPKKEQKKKKVPQNVSGTCGWAVSSCGAQVPGTL